MNKTLETIYRALKVVYFGAILILAGYVVLFTWQYKPHEEKVSERLHCFGGGYIDSSYFLESDTNKLCKTEPYPASLTQEEIDQFRAKAKAAGYNENSIVAEILRKNIERSNQTIYPPGYNKHTITDNYETVGSWVKAGKVMFYGLLGIYVIAEIIRRVFWYIFFKKEGVLRDSNIRGITEETVFKSQTKFEKSLKNTYSPDAITGRDLYIYKNLMLVWYNKLAGDNRYKDAVIQRLRTDWLDYMNALEDRNSYNFLFLEAENEKESETYREEHIIASRKVFAIEDSFASLVGGDAVKKLALARTWDATVIDIDGNLKVANTKPKK